MFTLKHVKNCIIGILLLFPLFIHYPDDIHMTEPVKGYYDALRFIYKGWK
jgi:hypothetical protein